MSSAAFAVADIGGTNARFAQARHTGDDGVELGEPIVLATGEHPDLASAWRAFLDASPGFEPGGAALALAGPVAEGRFGLTNAEWRFDAQAIPGELGLAQIVLLNDFEAVAHAVAADPHAEHIVHLAGPDAPLPSGSTITVIGPGTGLGVAHARLPGGPDDVRAQVQATEGSHVDFAPVCALDDRVLALLRTRHERVSLERVISGDGIAWIYAALAQEERPHDAVAIWRAGMSGADPVAAQAVAHFVATLGRACGDYALAHGASGVVLAGGLGLRLRDRLADPTFHQGFVAKGRYRTMMEGIPVKLITHPQPGLLGAARVYAERYRTA